MSYFNTLKSIANKNGYCLFALIDPDLKYDSRIETMLDTIHNSNFDAILVGGSKISDNNISKRINYIQQNTHLPIILFPGSSRQITGDIKALLYLNLISGRNPKYLIEEQVAGANKIYDNNIETIPTAYILLEGGNDTSVSIVSQTEPLKMNRKELVLSHSLAGQYMGNKILYFDCGSGSTHSISKGLLSYISEKVDIDIMVGGGIKSLSEVKSLHDKGASFIVVGNALEDNSYVNK